MDNLFLINAHNVIKLISKLMIYKNIKKKHQKKLEKIEILHDIGIQGDKGEKDEF